MDFLLLSAIWKSLAKSTGRGRGFFFPASGKNRAIIKFCPTHMETCWRLITLFLPGKKIEPTVPLLK